jgi:hypothetical protein
MTLMSEPTFEQTKLQPFSVTPDHGGGQTVTLAGQDISGHLKGLEISLSATVPYADVLLHLNPAAAMHPEIDVLARVVVADEPDIATAVTRFLSAIDAEALQQAALNRADLSPGPQGLTKAMLTQLIEWANGRS